VFILSLVPLSALALTYAGAERVSVQYWTGCEKNIATRGRKQAQRSKDWSTGVMPLITYSGNLRWLLRVGGRKRYQQDSHQ
jgi:hypothetical protein